MISEKVRWTLRVSASSSGLGSIDVGQLGDPGDQVGLLGDVGAEPHPLRPLDEDRAGVPSGTFTIRATTPTTPTS